MKNLEELFIQSKNPSIVWITAKFIEDKIGGQYYSTDYIEYERILKTNKLTVLKDVISEYNGGPMGFQLHSYDYLDQGVPVLRTKDMKELTIILDDPIFISQEKHNELKGSKTYPGDIIISKTGQIGVVAVVPKTLNEANLNQALCNIRVKEGIIDNYFLAVFLNSKYGQYQFIRQGEGKAVQNGLTKDEILDLQIPVISPEIQKYIGDKVRKAEELREEAKRLKKEAEEILLSSIGINLDSLNKESDNKYVWVEGNLIHDRIDCQYYDTLYEEIERKLMRNKCVNLIDLCEDFSITVPYSTDFGNKSNENIYPMYRVKNIEEYFVNMEDLQYMNSSFYEKNEKCRVFTGDILLSRVGSIGRASIYLNNEKAAMGQNVTRIRLKNNINKYYFLCYINSPISRLLMKRETNAGLQPNLTNENIKLLKVPILNKDIQDKIGNKILHFINITNNSKQLIQEAKQDVEDLIEGNFDMSKVKANS